MSAPHPGALTGAASSEDLHIERGGDSTAMYAVMYCGASCILGADGAPTPWMDWYSENFGHKATCPGCLTAWKETHP